MSKPAVLLLLLTSSVLCCAQTAEELVSKNLAAKGGVEKIKAIHTLRAHGKLQQGGFTAQTASEAKAPDELRETFTIQGMTQVQAYDGSVAWQISPFEGRKDPEMMGEDDARDLIEQADFYGPLVDYAQKGNRIEYLGHAVVDGDDALRLKVTLKNGDIFYYLLDPDTLLEIRLEKQQFIRGAVRESVTELGSYKQVAGVYFPFSLETGPKNNPEARMRVSYDTIEANVPIDDADFKMPAAPAVPSPQKHPEPPSPQQKQETPKQVPPAKPPQRP